jgi:hypothetical protein
MRSALRGTTYAFVGICVAESTKAVHQVINDAIASAPEDIGTHSASIPSRPAFQVGIATASTVLVVYAVSVAAFKLKSAYRRSSRCLIAVEEAERAWLSVNMLEISEERLPSVSRSLGYEQNLRGARRKDLLDTPLMMSMQSSPTVRTSSQ